MHRRDQRPELSVPQLLLGRCAGPVLVVGRGGDRATQLGELRADRLDPPAKTLPIGIGVTVTDVVGDERHDQRSGRSSSAAKKADAAFTPAVSSAERNDLGEFL